MRKDKVRDIARGVLPSTARKGARDNKRNFHAKHRHAQRQANIAIERSLIAVDENDRLYTDPDLYDDFEDRDVIDGYHARTKAPCGWDDDMKHIVRRRRDADKLGPLYAWAHATEDKKMIGWSNEDKYAYFKAVLPDTLQGRHALGHIETELDISNDEFKYGYYRYRTPHTPLTLEAFRAALSRHLSTTKSRAALREFLHETVPVAAHVTTTNNKVLTQVHAVDENGALRYLPPTHTDPSAPGYRPRRPYMVDAYVPQTVAVTCDDCSFLRNDPLATTEAINRFVKIVWNGRPRYGRYSRPKNRPDVAHDFLVKILNHVCDLR